MERRKQKGGGKLKLSKAYTTYIEHELYNYDETRLQIEAMRSEIIGSPATVGCEVERVDTGTKTGDPTQAKAIKLSTNTSLLRMEQTVRAIERALLLLDEDHNEIFELRYRQGKNWRQVTSELCMGQNMYFKKRREIIYAVAVQLGLEDP